MGVVLTAQGESLIARLQAEGKPLIIDRFLFAHIEGQNHTQMPEASQSVPANLVHNALIPPEYRAYVNPNQVVYSALLGSDVGDFSLNWQGLYCSEHDTLIAVSTFPELKKRAYNPVTNTAGNNLTRNFILEFSGARELTGITIEAAVWQLDFTVRLKGIDERERLSNRDIYGRAAFLDDGWKLIKEGEEYFLLPGVGYVEGIRVCLEQKTPVFPTSWPCDVWLDVCMERQGSDVVTVISPLLYSGGEQPADYVTASPYRVKHYLEKVVYLDTHAAGPQDCRVEAVLSALGKHARQNVLGGDAPHGIALAQVGAPGISEPDGETLEAKEPGVLSVRASTEALPDMLVRRDSAGRARIEPPEADKDIANKGYVDAALGGLTNFAAKPTKNAGPGQFFRVMGNSSYTLPAGGTWVYVLWAYGSSGNVMRGASDYGGPFIGVAAGGTYLGAFSAGYYATGFVWRVE